jgi:hypothetical protein
MAAFIMPRPQDAFTDACNSHRILQSRFLYFRKTGSTFAFQCPEHGAIGLITTVYMVPKGRHADAATLAARKRIKLA